MNTLNNIRSNESFSSGYWLSNVYSYGSSALYDEESALFQGSTIYKCSINFV